MKTEQLYDLFKNSAGISTDSRYVLPGQIFFALWGNNHNGNEYAAEALKKGALSAVIDDLLYETENTVLVDDCLLELQALASFYRKQLDSHVLAVTGTNGKTTTKELLAAILSKKLKVHCTKGNLNNHIGVPLTILSAPPDTELLIVEMGANHLGEISALCRIAEPDYGIITNIGKAHIEGFGSFEGVIKSKIELYEYLRKVNGIALYNDKNHMLSEFIFKLINRAVPFSDPTGIELMVDINSSDLNLNLIVNYNHFTYNIKTKLFGEYNLENVKAAIATGLFFEVDLKDIITAVEEYQPSNNRSQIKITKRNTLICDSYNANPTSMHHTLESFSKKVAENKVVILGDMLELGDESEEEHSKVLHKLQLYNFNKVFLVGSVFRKVSPDDTSRSFEDTQQLRTLLNSEPISNSLVLIKGSRAIGLERLYDIL